MHLRMVGRDFQYLRVEVVLQIIAANVLLALTARLVAIVLFDLLLHFLKRLALVNFLTLVEVEQ